MLKVNAEAYSVEAANPRHEHEWKLWKDVKLPEVKILIPGVGSHAQNLGFEPVADAAHGRKPTRRVGIVLDLAAQPADVLQTRLQRFLEVDDDRAGRDQTRLTVLEPEPGQRADREVVLQRRERGGRVEGPVRARDAALR